MPELELELIVDGRRYSGWKSIRVTRSVENIAGSFALEVSDRWGGQEVPWPIVEEDACRVEIGGKVMISGYVDKRSLSLSATARSLSYSGRDRAAALVDCSAIVAGASASKGNKWTYSNVDVVQFAREIGKQFGIGVSLQPGLVLKRDERLVIHPGDSGFEAISRAAGLAGVIVVSDSAGGIVVTRAGATRAASLIQGLNVKTASIEYDAADRFYTYLIASQVPGTDEASGEATMVQAMARDLGVRRKDRVILIRPDKGYNTADSRRRADWEARTRAARAEKVTIGVQGWTQPNSSELWPINALSLVRVPSIGIKGDMLISQVEFSIDDTGGQLTQLHLIRPDAFLPEPKATVSGQQPWLIFSGGEFREPGGASTKK